MAKWQDIHMDVLNLKTTGQNSLPMYVKQLSSCIQIRMRLKLLREKHFLVDVLG